MQDEEGAEAGHFANAAPGPFFAEQNPESIYF
jgi:hypothetical protein